MNVGRDAFEAAICDLGTLLDRWPATVRSLITGRNPVGAYPDLRRERPQGIRNVLPPG